MELVKFGLVELVKQIVELAEFGLVGLGKHIVVLAELIGPLVECLQVHTFHC